MGQKRFDEAEPLLLEAFNELMVREEHIPAHAAARLTEAQDAIIQMYQDWDRPDKAEQWRRQHFNQYVLLLDRLPPDPKTGWQHPRRKLARRIAESDDVFARVIEARPDDCQLWIERGRTLVLRSRWSEAVEAYRRAERRGIRIETFELAGALLLSGDQDGYRQLCASLLDDPDRPADATAAFHLARIVSFGPSGIEPERAVAWARPIVGEEGQPWHLHVLALAHYRAGNYVDTIRHCQVSNAQGWQAGLLNHWLLAMAHHQLGNSLAAANVQAQAESLAANWMSKESDEPISSVLPPDWISHHLLRRQFQELQSGAAAVPGPAGCCGAADAAVGTVPQLPGAGFAGAGGPLPAEQSRSVGLDSGDDVFRASFVPRIPGGYGAGTGRLAAADSGLATRPFDPPLPDPRKIEDPARSTTAGHMQVLFCILFEYLSTAGSLCLTSANNTERLMG